MITAPSLSENPVVDMLFPAALAARSPALGGSDVSNWADPVTATVIATVAVSLLLVTAWLLRRPQRRGRGAAAICLTVSVILHLLLIFSLPRLRGIGTSAERSEGEESGGDMAMIFSSFDPDAPPRTTAGDHSDPASLLQPLPLPSKPQPGPSLTAVGSEPTPQPATDGSDDSTSDNLAVASEADDAGAATTPNIDADSATEPADPSADRSPRVDLPSSLNDLIPSSELSDVADLLADWLSEQPDTVVAAQVSATEERVAETDRASEPSAATARTRASVGDVAATPPTDDAAPQATAASIAESAGSTAGATATVPGVNEHDFANRIGNAKRLALLQTGGDESTEAAVEAALRFLAADQRADGSWDPATSGAGRETLTLGTDRHGAGRRATTGITGLALLSMLGAGNSHRQGPYADNVRRGLTYLILNQKPDGSLAGEAAVYEATYCHGMATLAMAEAAAMTGDASAMASAEAAIAYTLRMQHPTTGGWRYVRGDPGDMSQLGWQAMALDAARTAGVTIGDRPFQLTGRFLRSVRGGDHGGLAAYRPGDGPSRTMTAEALATRLLLGESIPAKELKEAEDYLLRQLPGVGRDNYYCWYYASLALHQLQDDAWQRWNGALKQHLLRRQTANGSWPTDSEWGGYGGRVYTTAMAALCLEVYYRHQRRTAAVASADGSSPSAVSGSSGTTPRR